MMDINYLNVSSYSVISDLGSIDQIVFDKTDTLTSGVMKVAELSTFLKCYQVPNRDLKRMLIECTVNPEAFSYDDNLVNVMESADYSEKSQEYATELDGEYQREILNEDPSMESFLNPDIFPDYQNIGQRRTDPPSLANLSLSKKTSGMASKGEEFTIKTYLGNLFQPPHINEGEKLQPDISKELRQLNTLEKKFKQSIGAGLISDNASILKRAEPVKKILKTGGNRQYTDNHQREVPVNDSINSQMDISDIAQDLRIDFKVDKKLTDRNFVFDVQSKKDHLRDLLELLMVCIDCSSSDVRTVRSMSLEDRALCDLLMKISYVINTKTKPPEKKDERAKKLLSLSDYKTLQVISEFNTIHEFDVICVNAYTAKRGRMSIILRDVSNSDEEKFLLVVKGEDNSFKNNFSTVNMGPKELNLYKAMLTDYKIQGLKRVIIGTRKLTEEEVKDYLAIYNTISESSREQLDTFESHADRFEQDLYFMGCIGLKDVVREEAHILTADLTKAKIQVNILSGDSIDNCLNVAKELELTTANFSDTSSYFSVNFKSEKQGILDLRRMLDTIYELLMNKNLDKIDDILEKDKPDEKGSQKQTYEAKKYRAEKTQNLLRDSLLDILPEKKPNLRRTVVIWGPTLKLLSKPGLMRDYMKNILLFSNCVIGHSMQPAHKAIVVKLFQELGQTVMAVGDGLNDLAMFNFANVSVQLISKDVPVVLADLQIANLKLVGYLIFGLGTKVTSNIVAITIVGVCINTLWSSLLAFFMTSTLFSSSFFSDAELIIFYIINCAGCVAYLLWNQPYSRTLLLTYPSLYFEGRVVHSHLTKLLVLFIFYSLLEALFIQFTWESIGEGLPDINGHMLGSSGLGILAMWTIGLTSLTKIYQLWTRPSVSILIGYCGLGLLLTLCYLVELVSSSSLSFRFPAINMIMSNPVHFFLVVFMCCTLSLINFVMITLVKNMIIYPVGHFITRTIKKKKMQELVREGLDSASYKIIKSHVPNVLKSDPILQIKKCYSSTTISDSQAQKILSTDFFNFSLPIDGFNRIKDLTERRKYSKARRPTEITFIRLYLAVTLFFTLANYLILVLFGDFRGNYMIDSPVAYSVIVYGFLLLMCYAEIGNYSLVKIITLCNALFVFINVVSISWQVRLQWTDGYYQVSKFIMAPIASQFIPNILLGLVNDFYFALS